MTAPDDWQAALAAAGLKYPPQHPPANLLLTPDEWCRVYGVIVLDPDGWRGPVDPKPWDEPVSVVEFHRRAVYGNSTCDFANPAWEGVERDARLAQQLADGNGEP